LADETLAAFASAYNYKPAENGQQYVDKVLSPFIFPRAQRHHSSMYQDLQAGRKSEIDFFKRRYCQIINTSRFESDKTRERNPAYKGM
jgi:ketopantoate reductase